MLHEVGQALHVTSGRRLREALAQGQDNVVVMLNRVIELDGPGLDLSDWTIWWGANLGSPHEELVAGPLADVLDDIAAARARAKEADGWVMDTYLLRRAVIAG